MKLKSVSIQKYKSIDSTQGFDVDPAVTVLVGMNEAGKTSVLEAIAKTRYFVKDEDFEFSTTHDYPRREKKSLDKSGIDPVAVECTYTIAPDEQAAVERQIGKGTISGVYVVATQYSGTNTIAIDKLKFDTESFWRHCASAAEISSKKLVSDLTKIKSVKDIERLAEGYADDGNKEKVLSLCKYATNTWKWDNPALEYTCRTVLEPLLPKFLYYDEYYALPSRISIEKLESGKLDSESMKTARALFELADISAEDITKSDSFEDFIAELEATEAIISDELFKYWKTNRNLKIRFAIDKVIDESNPSAHRVKEHVLDIRVLNSRTAVSLPLQNRSKGFNWFFSFLVWFKRIQEAKDNKYVLLLDEPGLNLHASAQSDLLEFIEGLSSEYQVIFTTHSPFMIEPDRLHRVRTVVETNEGTAISDSVQEKDPRTLFPLQAALGYDLAQNLFISSKNLLVEGISDLVLLQHMSATLEQLGRQGLREDVTLVPTGGLDKVATFVSLLRGSKLEIACLLDTPRDKSAKAGIDRMIVEKLTGR